MAFRRNQNATKEEETRPKFSKDSFRKSIRIFKFLNPYRWLILLGMVLLTISSVVFMVFPAASGEFINIATGKSEYNLTIRDLGIGLLVILVIQSVVSYIRVVIFTYVSEHAMSDIRKALYSKIVSLPITFFENNRVGELTSRTTNDVQQLQEALSIYVAEFFRQIITLIIGIYFLLYKTPKLSLLMFATFPVIVIIAIVFGRYIRRFSKQRQDELAATNVILDESLQSISAVKAFTNEWFEVKRYGSSIDKVVKLSMSYGIWRGAFLAFIIAVVFGVIFFILWQGASLVQDGTMKPGDLVSFIVITGIIGGSIGGLGDLYTQILRAMGASERILEILGMKSEIEIKAEPVKTVPVKGDIVFDHVGFSYPGRPDVEVLKDISFQIKSGEKVALVGSSGAGKSTIVQLIMRFYDTQKGKILVDGNPIEGYNISGFRGNLAIVPQEILLFGGTIRENILYGSPGASDAEVIEAAEQSFSMEFIRNFPEGLETIVGERGIKLSGGQRQRIAIARAILKDPALLILDEATSSLDAESEKLVQAALEELMKGRTSIIIAHRLATIRNVDKIYVLDAGMIVEEGTHDQLIIKESGLYQNLAKLQFENAIS